MRGNRLIIITGAPCTGKTTLANKLSGDFKLPFINKDVIKELLFDTLGWEDREYSKRIGKASFAILYHVLDKFMSSGQSIVVEANLKPSYDSEKFQSLVEKYQYQSVQIFCKADDEVLLSRFKKRIQEERHPGHDDSNTIKEAESVLFSANYAPLNLDGAIIEIDTTDFSKMNYGSLLEQLNAKN